MATATSSPSSPPPYSPPSSLTPISTATKKPHPLPWTHQETVHLIQAYQEKWYSLKRGQLKANQWEEVAVNVAACCGYDYNHQVKTALQCRHKMEKLRRKYRDEKRRVSFGGSCRWPYYDLMYSMEQGPLPISARPLPPYGEEGNDYENGFFYEDENNEEEEEEEEEEDDYGYGSKSRSINYILRKPATVNRFAGSGTEFLPETRKGRKREEVEEEEEEKEGAKELELAAEIRAFSEKMVSMERKKMKIMKDTEKWRMEMENKRSMMILDSQRKILDMIQDAFGSH